MFFCYFFKFLIFFNLEIYFHKNINFVIINFKIENDNQKLKN